MSDDAITHEQLQNLVRAAIDVRAHAHAPYSGFRVGAAVLTTDGVVFSGCNVEVSSYSHTCCAERVAVFKSVSSGHQRLVAVAVVTDVTPPVSPCGACRQVLHDFGPDMVVVLANTDGHQRTVPLSALLPDAFRPEQVLGKIRQRYGHE